MFNFWKSIYNEVPATTTEVVVRRQFEDEKDLSLFVAHIELDMDGKPEAWVRSNGISMPIYPDDEWIDLDPMVEIDPMVELHD